MSNVTLHYSAGNSTSDPNDRPVVIIGQIGHLTTLSFEAVKTKFGARVDEETFKVAVSSLQPSPTDHISIWFNNATVASLPLKASRHNTPSRAHAIPKLVKAYLTNVGDECVVIVCERKSVFASGCAVARAFPLYSRKTGANKLRKRTVTVEFILVGEGSNQSLSEDEMKCLQEASEGIRLTGRIVDAPCNEMHTDAFIEEIKNVGRSLGIEPVIVRGEELDERGFGGIYGVGKAADHPPALVILKHTSAAATQTISWVGKGIVYDTGGLSIKGKTAMPGMKRDCGGAAAILGAFVAAVKLGFKENLNAVFCLAENAVGPLATRPDDVHILYSGRSVEINNTDAEGRLVLGDGVAYAVKDLKSDIILDMATLTGAQGISTGKYHSAVLTNTEQWEQATVKAGKNSGDLVFPLVYCPELHFSEFGSAVADMKNSVADRSNAQSSCAGLFIGAHIGFDYSGSWIHLDIASPCYSGERATGYGVALLLSLFGRASESKLLQSVSPLGSLVEDQLVENASKKIRLV
ncbi:probable aminopeptidase NPEPL1 isoform X2 [Anneissia japonica]|uniref:probable aminopeptidase NPEPL1 isoform X1 n=1 Tax=Anneissia japonica TaxID=1529436 RepID=UPI001425BAC4|nr:probable aminopeptidase NPEPL1 isoform X1 [Anneissia japonica]XP_033096252.1 probable aminopeptidase NPEPL1 isoform X2 [Anneissia japonica]